MQLPTAAAIMLGTDPLNTCRLWPEPSWVACFYTELKGFGNKKL